ncbi:MAG: 16S rRNA (uracil(1498)-N(3))-methyltransferase, partial [Bacteroidales bacterium]|nr:16S rRNA (uracil(1498)-N(3))-methyltransferase [Bacteroidales bacterium]
NQIEGDTLLLDAEESGHCVRVLRHRAGDEITVIDGEGTLYRCTLLDADPRGATAHIDGSERGFGAHPYTLTMAVCPTKNIDRYEWFVEKATEIGIDVIAPVIGERSERKVLKTERLERLVKSAAKQSLKGAIPKVYEPQSVRDFILSVPEGAVKMICYCFEGDKHSIPELLSLPGAPGAGNRSRPWLREREGPAPVGVGGMSEAKFPAPGAPGRDSELPDIYILIGPEGDFSPAEAELALSRGWMSVSLGSSRLRTETAALVAVTQVYTCLGE